MRVRLTGRGRTFLTLGIAVIAVAALLGFPDITRIGALLAALPVLAVVSVWRARPRLEVRRDARPALLRPGDAGRVVLQVRNTGRRTVRQHLAEEQLDHALGGPTRFVLPRTVPGETRTAVYEVVGHQRGLYRPGPLAVSLQDPFSLARTRLTLPASGEIVVLPRIVPLDGSDLRRHGGAGDWPVPNQVAAHGEDDVSTRAYQHGDELRRIHWPATAHRAQLMVRQEEQPARRRAVLVLDSRRLAHHGRESGSFEWAVSALASVAVHLDARGHSLHLVSTETVREERAGSALPLPEILRHLALALPEAGDLEPVVAAARPLDAGLVVAVVGDGPPEPARQLARDRRSGTTGIMLALDGTGFDGSGPSSVAAVTDAALAAGWRVRPVTGETDVGALWRDITTVRAARLAASGGAVSR
ncbi:DUF58 domain-containing protein [Georgenia halophila]|uniref:DUF58 domain-containing protein n=1 Tax=Georgenia halophila TaxID=620889 RepID=A0ABP8L8E7_9MICO